MGTKSKRFIIEGTWSGYTDAQQRVVHRQVYSAGRKKFRAWAEYHHAIYYTDGTALMLSVRNCKPRERVKEIRGYTSLIEDCFHYNTDRVSALEPAREAVRAALNKIFEPRKGETTEPVLHTWCGSCGETLAYPSAGGICGRCAEWKYGEEK